MNKTTNAVCELSVCTVLRDELQDEMSHRVCVECDIDSEQVVAGSSRTHRDRQESICSAVARAACFGNLFYFLRLCLHYEYVIHSPLNFNFSSLSLRVDGCARRPSPLARGSYVTLLWSSVYSEPGLI